jgi:hypothetical protein
MLTNQMLIDELLSGPKQNNINERVKYTANTGLALIDTANPNLDGTGATVQLITAAAFGTQIKSVTIKAITETSQGIVRFFVFNGASYYLIDEIKIPPTKKSDTWAAFEISYDLEYSLIAGYSIYVSTQNSDSFIISAAALDWTY